jgi:predicted nucleic acid-binding protein
MQGLYDGDFVGFRRSSDDEIDTALGEAVVAIDANVLLNLYRFRAQTSRDLLKVLASLSDRLIVPHQALREFWRHRQRSAASPRAATATAEEALAKATHSLTQSLETWAKQVGIDAEELAAFTDRIADFASTMKQDLAATYEDAGSQKSSEDPILDELEKLLAGRVTDALDQETWNTCLVEAERRIQEELPPGYRDAAKEDSDPPEGGAGDYLVWYQATRHAASAGSDLVIVTADEKEDWWWRQRAVFVGPRPELTLEFHELCGRRLFLLRPSDLLARAAALQVEIDANSVADADRPREADQPATPLDGRSGSTPVRRTRTTGAGSGSRTPACNRQ